MKHKNRILPQTPPTLTPGTLAPIEPHPAAQDALAWLKLQGPAKIAQWHEAMASAALAGNRLGQVCADTLDRLVKSQPVSDRYMLGLAWTLRDLEERVAKDTQVPIKSESTPEKN